MSSYYPWKLIAAEFIIQLQLPPVQLRPTDLPPFLCLQKYSIIPIGVHTSLRRSSRERPVNIGGRRVMSHSRAFEFHVPSQSHDARGDASLKFLASLTWRQWDFPPTTFIVWVRKAYMQTTATSFNRNMIYKRSVQFFSCSVPHPLPSSCFRPQWQHRRLTQQYP